MSGFFGKLFAGAKTETPMALTKPKSPFTVGAMFRDLDHPDDDRFIKIVGLIYDDGYDKVRFEFFPSLTPSYMNAGLSFFKRYERLSAEEEAKWEKDFFSDRDAYFQREKEALEKKYQDQIDARNADIRKKIDAEAVAIKKRIDNKKNKFVVFNIGSPESFEALLNYGVSKGLTLSNTTIRDNGVFVAVMVRK